MAVLCVQHTVLSMSVIYCNHKNSYSALPKRKQLRATDYSIVAKNNRFMKWVSSVATNAVSL